jgi:predicted ATPase
MADPRTQLAKKFDEANRYATFGNVLSRLEVRGFRGHANTTLEFRSPITAICGANGTGKTTLLQLAACAYREGGGGFRVSDFFAVGPLDPAPFEPKAQFTVGVWQNDRTNRFYTISRGTSRWSAYGTRAERRVVMLSAADFLPRVDSQDFAFRYARQLKVGATTQCTDGVGAAVAKVIGMHYDGIARAEISVAKRIDSILSSQRGAVTYSENHMGFGECRIHNLIDRLEQEPENCLLVLEEPETSLHQAAQFRLGEYLIDLAIRRGHQILVSTHSEHLLRALPQASRVMLARDHAGRIKVLPGLASLEAASLMAEGHDKALTAIVEDDVAYNTITELLRAVDPMFLTTVGIIVGGYRDDHGQVVGGGKDAIKVAMRTFQEAGLRIAAVLDADATADPKAFVFCLPGSKAPEFELFENATVQAFWATTYGLDVKAFVASLAGVDPHDWFDKLASRVGQTREFVIGEAARVYATANKDAARILLEQLREAASRK